MSDRDSAALAVVAVVAIVTGVPLAAQRPSAAMLRAEARSLAREIDSLARAARTRRPELVRVVVPGGWSAMVSPALATRAPAPLGTALAQLRGTYGADLFPDTLPIRVVADTAWPGSSLIQVGSGRALPWVGGLLQGGGELEQGALDAGRDGVFLRGDSAFRGWVRFSPFVGDFDLRSRVDLGTTSAPTAVSCRRGDLAGCVAALGLRPGVPGTLDVARASLFQFAFARRRGASALARFYADSTASMAARLGALAGSPPEHLVAEWRHDVLLSGNTRGADVVATLLGSMALLGLALAGIRRRSV